MILNHPARPTTFAVRRTGNAAVECAICLPTLALLVMGSIEACSMIFLEHSLSIAAYEGVRVAIRHDSDSTQVSSRVNELLTARNVDSGSHTITPGDVASVAEGDSITVSVSAPCNDNSLFSPWFYDNKTLSAQVTMVKE